MNRIAINDFGSGILFGIGLTFVFLAEAYYFAILCLMSISWAIYIHNLNQRGTKK